MYLSSTPYKRSYNLQFIRFIAALLVILSHSFSLCGNICGEEFFNRYTNGELSLGGISVSVFFICGGYLITASLQKKNKFVPFFKARLIRLIPPLATVTVLCVILCAFISDFSFAKYFANAETYKYLLNICLIPTHNLPGVFTNNPITTVNGALWTLPVEFADYICVFLLFKLHLIDKRKFLYTLPLPVAALVCERFLPEILAAAIRPTVLFYIGVAFFVYRDKIKLKPLPAAVCLILFAVLIYFKLPDIALYLCLPYMLFYVSFGIKQIPGILGNCGNISYCMYLWGFPVQQTFVHFFGVTNPYLNFAVSSAITVVLALLTYLISEKPFLKRK